MTASLAGSGVFLLSTAMTALVFVLAFGTPRAPIHERWPEPGRGPA